MTLFRSFLVILSFLIFGFGSFVINFIIFPFKKNFLTKTEYELFASRIIQKSWSMFVNWIIFIGLIKLDIKNKDYLTSIQGKIIVSTHPSLVDIVILMSLIPKSVCFVKSKLKNNPILKNILNSIFITNDTELDIICNETKKYLDNGYNVIIFPVGKRHKSNEKLKKGAALTALNAKKDIIPVKITTDEDFLYINKPFYDGGKKTVTFEIEGFEPVLIENYLNKDEITAKKEITKQIEKRFYL